MRTKEEVVAVLKSFDIGDKLSDRRALPRASVLVPLFVRDGQLRTLMTLRSAKLRAHAGQVCFPGGKRDPRDRDEVDTALREAEEEIGLTADDVEVVCRLFPVMHKQSGLLVTPVVGFIEESFCPRPNPAEVSDVFTVPLDLFISVTGHSAAPTVESPLSFHFADTDSGSWYHIWGLTAVLAMLVATLALGKKPKYDVGFDFEDPFPFFQKVLQGTISKL